MRAEADGAEFGQDGARTSWAQAERCPRKLRRSIGLMRRGLRKSIPGAKALLRRVESIAKLVRLNCHVAVQPRHLRC